MQSYDYANREGILPISWEDFASLAAKLAEGLAGAHIDTIVGIARAGLFPATFVSCALRRELYPVRISRRINDEVRYRSPVWHVPVPEAAVAGKVVAVIDEIVDTGETLATVSARVSELGAKEVITAALIAHSWASPAPNVCALISDALVLFPWDARVYTEGEWRPHPELAQALAAQKKERGEG